MAVGLYLLSQRWFRTLVFILVGAIAGGCTAATLWPSVMPWEILISADFPILGLGVFSKGDSPYEPAVKFIEGIGLLWGSISFHALQLSKTITGKITNIKELPSAPMSNGRLILRLLTLDTSSVGPLAMKLSRPESERN